MEPTSHTAFSNKHNHDTGNIRNNKYCVRDVIIISSLIIVIVGSYYIFSSDIYSFSSSKPKVHLMSNFRTRNNNEDNQRSSSIFPVDNQAATGQVSPSKSFIFVIGDSHIYYLQEAINDGMIRNAQLDFNTRTEVVIYGIPGATIDRLRASMSLVNLYQTKRPDVVFLHIGGNDADSETPVDQVRENIVQYVKELKTVYGVKEVVLSEQFHRKAIRHLPNNVYDKKILDLNRALQFRQGHVFWKHSRLNSTKQDILSDDGVHLNNYGQQLFYLSIVEALKDYIDRRTQADWQGSTG